jgi:hypothetical protein
VDPELKTMMEELLKLTRENNTILSKVRNHQKWVQIYKAIYWVIIISVAFGGFYFIQPYLSSTLNYYNAVTGGESSSGTIPGTSIPDIKHLQDLLKQVNGQ